jgi:hypothetical protein
MQADISLLAELEFNSVFYPRLTPGATDIPPLWGCNDF